MSLSQWLFGGLSGVGRRNHVLDVGLLDPTVRDNFGRCPAHWKALGTV